MSTGTASGRARLRGRIDTAVQTLHPGYFAFVMATGIISTGTFLLGPSWLSQALLIAASAGLIALAAALTVRVFRFHSAVVADINAPDRVFGFFTTTAGLDVLGVRLALAGHPLLTAVLAGLAATGPSVTNPPCGASSSRSACTASPPSPSARPATCISWSRSPGSCSGSLSPPGPWSQPRLASGSQRRGAEPARRSRTR
jgi:hypothetical protein